MDHLPHLPHYSCLPPLCHIPRPHHPDGSSTYRVSPLLFLMLIPLYVLLFSGCANRSVGTASTPDEAVLTDIRTGGGSHNRELNHETFPGSDVKAYGATGDGVTDDTDAIRAAVAAGHGEVIFPRGSYRIMETIEINLTEHGATGLRGREIGRAHV